MLAYGYVIISIITHPCHNLGHACVITPHCLTWCNYPSMLLVKLLVYLISVRKRNTTTSVTFATKITLQWRHNDHDSVSNHQPPGCWLNRLFRRRSKKTSKLRVTGLCVGNSPGPVNSPHKGPVMRKKKFPFGDVIMNLIPHGANSEYSSIHIDYIRNSVIIMICSSSSGCQLSGKGIAGLILGLHPANKRRRYFVTTSLTGWAQA